MLRLRFQFIVIALFLFQSVAYGHKRNFDIVDHPRYKHLKERYSTPDIQYQPNFQYGVNEKRYQKFNVLTLDTRDQAICQYYADTIRQQGTLKNYRAQEICQIDYKNPYISIAIEPRVTHKAGIRYSELSEREQKLVRQTGNFMVPALGMMALLYALPKSFTGWESFESEGLGEKWENNVKAGPVMDKDHWAVNYIGHPYAGAAYYVVARHAGFTQTESFFYSAFMSTFFWEYGIEAFAEVPSIQDLILTPVLGSILGEFFVEGSKRVRENDGRVLGSKFLGSTSLFLMDPAGGILDASDRFMQRSPFQDSDFYFYTQPNPSRNETRFGFELILWFKKTR